ncbi:MAG: hypothetical protein WKF31_07115 [Thermoleophilaceae bacterium]
MRGIGILVAIVVVLIAVGYGLAELVFLPFGGSASSAASSWPC